MILKLTEFKSNKLIAVNTQHIVAVFEGTEGEFNGQTILSLVNGSVAVTEDLLTVLGQLAAV